MSVHVLSWVLRSSEETLGRRLVLIVLADHAHDDGSEAWPSVETIAREARLSTRQVQRCLRDLEAAGSIRKTGTSRTGTSVFAVVMQAAEGGDNLSERGRHIVPVGATSDAGRGDDMSPEPSLEQPPKESSVELARASLPRSVDRKPVATGEAVLAVAVLAEWNSQTGQSLSSKDWLTKIILRIREHRDLLLVEHAHIIAVNLARPWWKGHPTPSVIYGNGAQFERAKLEAEKGVAPGTGLTPEEVRRFAG